MKNSILKNEKGFGLVSFLALTPLLVAVIAFVSSLALLLKTDAKLKHECRTQLLESQRSISKRLNQILLNNKVGSALRLERLAAEALVRATVMAPPANAAARAELESVRFRQSLYKANQKRLITTAKAQSAFTPHKTSFAVKGKLIEEAKMFSHFRASPLSRTSNPTFEMEETPKNNDSPDYVPVKNFTAKQEMKVSVEFDLATVLPDWLKAFLPQKSMRIKTECNATLEKENEKWIERLSAVR